MKIQPPDLPPDELSPLKPLSYEIVNRVRDKISTEYVRASDTEVARALGVSRAAISAYKTGRDVMSSSTFAAAAGLLQLEMGELADLALRLRAEASLNASEKDVWLMIRGWLIEKTKAAGKRVASILLVGLVLFTAHGKASANVLDVVLSWDLSNHPSIHYVHLRASLTRLLRKLFRCLKPKVAAPLTPSCARRRSTAFPPQSWRRSAACI